jgi:hypothetical protein
MNIRHFIGMSATAATCAAIVLAGSLAGILRAHADGDDRNAEESKIRRGFEIAPVPLNLRNKNRELVGLGSYIVNAVGDCNGCHTTSNATQYAPGGNPSSRVTSQRSSIRTRTSPAAIFSCLFQELHRTSSRVI